MSVVVVLREKGTVFLGSDSTASGAMGQVWYNRQKIWQNSEDILMGGVGDVEVIEFVKYAHPFQPEMPTNKNIYEWMLPLYEAYKDPEKYVWSFIIAGNGKAFLVESDFLITEIESYEAIGSGRDIAMGAMFATQHKRELPEDRIKTAIGAAMMYNVGVGGNIDIQMI